MERKRGLGAALRPYQAKPARSIIYPGADPCKTRLAVAFKVIRENAVGGHKSRSYRNVLSLRKPRCGRMPFVRW